MEPVPFAPGPAVLEILEGERKRAGDRYVVASTGLDGALSLKGDEGMFSILVSTLLENAFRYTPEGGSIRAAGQVEGDRWLLEIANSRGDFDEKDQERIFRPFQRGSKVSVNTPGAGLGLPLAREISIWLGGTLDIRLTGQEVVFCLSFPLE